MGRKMKGIESGNADIATDGAGVGIIAITFENPMDSTDYSVVATAQEVDATGSYEITLKTVNGFTLGVKGSAVLTGVLTTSWIANQNSF